MNKDHHGVFWGRYCNVQYSRDREADGNGVRLQFVTHVEDGCKKLLAVNVEGRYAACK